MSLPPIRIGHPDEGALRELCGCCDGIAFGTPLATVNRPNLSAVLFRAGDHGRFKASMLANLSTAEHAALTALGTRDDDDFTIALIDAWASACDVLTFYQERFANEAYIGTALSRSSIGELARLTGYRLHPGAAAETELVLLMDNPPGAEPDVTELTVPVGTRVQSQPGPDEEAQVFETIEPLEARVAWNRLVPRQARRIMPADGDRQAWLRGAPALQPGDTLLFLGPDRWVERPDASEMDSLEWNVRRVVAVEPDAEAGRTLVTWDAALNSIGAAGSPGSTRLRLFHLRERASLFGHNAPSPKILSAEQLANFAGTFNTVVLNTVTIPVDWIFSLVSGTHVPLDAIYKGFVAGGWVVLMRGSGAQRPYRITAVRDDGRTQYAVSGRSTLLTFELTAPEQLNAIFVPEYRSVAVYGGSEELFVADTPLHDLVGGNSVELDRRVDGLPEERKLILRGPRAQARVQIPVLSIEAVDGALRGVTQGAVLTLMAAPQPLPATSDLLWTLRDADGFTGVAEAEPANLLAVPAAKNVEEIAEVAILNSVLATDTEHSTLMLDVALGAAFDRTRLAIHANVARAAHGEGATDILGSGDPATPFQKFPLKQAPVTHRLAASETGVASTLLVRVDGVEWQEVPDLYDRRPNARVYSTVLTDAGETIVTFGDGRSGARPPPGRDNIVADYSKGLGLAGNLRAGQLTMPIDRPLGLRETTNPRPATGGDDPEASDAARRNAPLHTLTLGRVVSLTDYRDFARAYPGIAKAEARWVWQGQTRRIVVTVAGPDGAEVAPGSTTHDHLLDAFRSFGDPLVDVDLLSYARASFRLGLRVAVDPAHDEDTVLAATDGAMRDAFSFAARDFAQPVALSEIAAVAHTVVGVRAVDVDLLARTTPPQIISKAHALLVSLPSRHGPGGALLPAEILTLAPGPLAALQVMP